MTGTNCDLFTHNQSRSYLNHLVLIKPVRLSFFFFLESRDKQSEKLEKSRHISSFADIEKP
jgi:hypothetical protein